MSSRFLMNLDFIHGSNIHGLYKHNGKKEEQLDNNLHI